MIHVQKLGPCPARSAFHESELLLIPQTSLSSESFCALYSLGGAPRWV